MIRKILYVLMAVCIAIMAVGCANKAKSNVEKTPEVTSAPTPTLEKGLGIPRGALVEVFGMVREARIKDSLFFINDNLYYEEVSDEQWDELKAEIEKKMDTFYETYMNDPVDENNSIYILIEDIESEYGFLVDKTTTADYKSKVDENYETRMGARKEYIVNHCDTEMTPVMAKEISKIKSFKENSLEDVWKYIGKMIESTNTKRMSDSEKEYSSEMYETVVEKYSDCVEFVKALEDTTIISIMDDYDKYMESYADVEKEIADGVLAIMVRDEVDSLVKAGKKDDAIKLFDGFKEVASEATMESLSETQTKLKGE